MDYYVNFSLDLPFIYASLVALAISFIIVIFALRPFRVVRREADKDSGIPMESFDEENDAFQSESDSEAEMVADAESDPEAVIAAETKDDKKPLSSVNNNSSLPGISIVVHSEGDNETLNTFLEYCLEQNYDNFEIIVVNDASAAATAMLAEQFEGNERIYFTFIPPGSQVLSRHKLALTIGIKAAKKDIIVTTTGYARPLGRNWLLSLATPFSDKKCGAVLATASPDFSQFKVLARPFRRLGFSMRTANWVYAALCGKPYRGSGYNLAFRKSLFFSNKGYSRGVLLEGGDDDLFIESIAHDNNIAVNPSPAARVRLDWGESTRRLLHNMIRRNRESEKQLETKRTNLTLMLLILNIMLIFSLVAMVLFMPDIIGIASTVVILLTVGSIQWITLRRLSRALS